MKTFLITGVAGFIGSAIARQLVKDGHTVIGVDNFLTGLKENVSDDVDFFEIDITDIKQLDTLNDHKIDGVFHLAAQTSGEISFEDPAKDLLTNALGTLNMLRYCKDRGIKRFIYTSSATVYGDSEVNPIPIGQEEKPKSYYGITKLTGEHYVRIFSNDIDTTVFRLFNVYGPGQNLQNTKQGMVSIYLYYFMNDEPILVKGSGDRFRDFVYIDDVVSGLVSAIDEPNTFGKKYNLSSGEQTTVAELLELLKEKWGDPDRTIEYAEGTPGDAFGSQADIEPIKADLDWEPRVHMEEGIERTVEWVKQVV